MVPGKTIPRRETLPTKSHVAAVVSSNTLLTDCGSLVVDYRGTGLITSTGSGYVMVSGFGQLNFGPCTEKSCTRGRSYFVTSDIVTYETYQYGGKKWARKVTCL